MVLDERSLSWDRKYRPATLDDYMGEAIKKQIMPRLSDPSKYAQTYLLEGTRGSGKTTLARLIAKEMLCEHKVDGHACNKCGSCMDLNENLLYGDGSVRLDSVIEIDAGVNTGKEDVANLMDEMGNEPIGSKYKICIIDECHKLSQSAQSALLKRLEEPRSYEVYILCTTNKEKMLETILGRLSVKVHVTNANLDDLVHRLISICKAEGVSIGTEAVKRIATVNDCNPRESIKMLEDLVKSVGHEIRISDVLERSGSVNTDLYFEYFTAANKSQEALLAFIDKVKSEHVEIGAFFSGLVRFVLDCIRLSYGVGLDNYTSKFVSKAVSFFKQYNVDEIDTLCQIMEYTLRTYTADTDKSVLGELLILTTGMRIGKIKLLTAHEAAKVSKATKENDDGLKKFAEGIAKKRDESLDTIRETELNSGVLASVFGRELVKVSNVSSASLFGDEDDEEEEISESEHDRKLTDEEFIGDFMSKIGK